MPNDWSQYAAPPTLDRSLFDQPTNDNWARSTKRQAYSDQFSKILGAGTDYANYLTGEETRRYNESNATLRNAASRFDKPSMTDQDIERQFSGYGDKAAMDYSKNLGQLRTTLGGSGVTGGGWAGGQQGRFAAAHMASMTDATRTLYEKRIDSDMKDRMDRWMAQQAVAAGQAREPSMVALDWTQYALNAITGKRGLDEQASAQYHAEKDAKTAGWFDLAKGAIGAAGAFA